MLNKIVVEEALRELLLTNELLLVQRTVDPKTYIEGKVDGIRDCIELVSKLPSIEPLKI
jgi:hypothetical protein